MISIIIPTFNTALLIERSIRSVLNQKNISDFELIIVDDCSTDDTLDVVHSINDPRIRIFRQRENRGPAAARNRGLAEAKGEYFAYLDGDDYWEPEFLAKTSDFLNKYKDAVAVSVMQCHKILGKAPAIAPVGIDIEQPVVLDDFFAFWAKYCHVCTGSVLMRTDIARTLGGQREDLRICEDLEFWILLGTQGKWGFIPEVLFTSDGGIVTQKQGWLEKNMRRWKSAPTVDDWVKRFSNFEDKSFLSVKGRIARNLCYSHIMCKKTKLAREEVLRYGNTFPKSKINKIFCIVAKSHTLWKIFTLLLRYRELSRRISE